MRDFDFSDSYMEKLCSIKSADFKERLLSGLLRVNAYLGENGREDVYVPIEKIVPPVEKGNIITSHEFCALSGVGEDIEDFIEMMIEDLWDWFRMDLAVTQCKLFFICLYIDGYSFTSESIEKFRLAVMMEFIENMQPFPEIIVITGDKDSEDLENGYYVLALK